MAAWPHVVHTFPVGVAQPELLALTVAAVARRLGIAPATLRTWDRRYGLGPSAHSAGAHRRYTAADLARLELMRRLILTGIPPVDAARLALQEQPNEFGEERLTTAATPGGGRVVPVAGAVTAARGLARAAQCLDSAACHDMLRDSMEANGVVWTWENLLVPVLAGMGEKWQNQGDGIEIEHVLSEAAMVALGNFTQRLRNPVNARPVLLACSAQELHSLPLFALAAALAERRISSRNLGSRLPLSALVAAMRRTGPAAVFVWSQVRQTGDASYFSQLPQVRPTPVILAGGPGWQEELPPGVVHANDLTQTVTRIATAVGL